MRTNQHRHLNWTAPAARGRLAPRCARMPVCQTSARGSSKNLAIMPKKAGAIKQRQDKGKGCVRALLAPPLSLSHHNQKPTHCCAPGARRSAADDDMYAVRTSKGADGSQDSANLDDASDDKRAAYSQVGLYSCALRICAHAPPSLPSPPPRVHAVPGQDGRDEHSEGSSRGRRGRTAHSSGGSALPLA